MVDTLLQVELLSIIVLTDANLKIQVLNFKHFLNHFFNFLLRFNSSLVKAKDY